jgi:3-(3-hydroxy-phenyl)propionate hydroxylase
VQDADNLAWKLKLVSERRAPDALLDTYGSEREFAADENIRNSTRSTDFITPKSPVSRIFRDAVLQLAKDYPFARRLVNSGRLSVPATYADSPLNTPDRDAFAGQMVPGAPCADAPIAVNGEAGWFLSHIGGGFNGVYFSDGKPLSGDLVAALQTLAEGGLPVRPLVVVPAGARNVNLPGITVLEDAQGLLAQRFDARPGTVYLLRPDQHVCARWRSFETDALRVAQMRAICSR